MMDTDQRVFLWFGGFFVGYAAGYFTAYRIWLHNVRRVKESDQRFFDKLKEINDKLEKARDDRQRSSGQNP